MANQIHDQIPCLHCHPDSFIRMVQHLIERCLVVNMRRDDCIAALEEHANIDPIITITVWEELRKENWSFFESYDIHAVSSVHDDSMISSISGDSVPNEAESKLRKENKTWSDQEEISCCR